MPKTEDEFWSSVDLTGNQTSKSGKEYVQEFWSSVDLTGNQTVDLQEWLLTRFGAVSI